MSPPITILPTRRDDLGAILTLERSDFAEPERWSERSWLGELLGEGRTVLLARAQAPAGVVTIATVDRVADLHRLVVAPAHRRAGVGTALVVAAVEAARRAGVRSVMLEVGYRNEPAIALYQRLGFEQLAVRTDYYGPGQHALILKLWDVPSWTAPGGCS